MQDLTDKKIIEMLDPYVKEVNSAITLTATIPLFAFSKFMRSICFFEKGTYRWFGSVNDLKKSAKEFYSKELNDLEKEYDLSKLKNEIKLHVRTIPKWKKFSFEENVIFVKRTIELLEKWWNQTIILEGIKYTDIEVFVDPFIKNNNLDPKQIALFKESMHLKGIDRETKRKVQFLGFIRRKDRLSKDEFEQELYLNPKYIGYDRHELYSKEELEIDPDELKKSLIRKHQIDPDKALEELKKTLDISKDDEKKIKITRLASQILDERRYFSNLLNMCLHVLVEQISKIKGVEEETLNNMTYTEFLTYLEGKEVNSRYPKLFFDDKEIEFGSFAKLRFENIEKQLEKTTHRIDEFKGFGASKGKVRGKVRIVLDPKEGKIEPGEILVTYYTNPEFVPLMRKAKGIITEGGGVTSHAAIVSRELGVPAIVGIKNAVTQLKTGEMVELDGANGKLRRLS